MERFSRYWAIVAVGALVYFATALGDDPASYDFLLMSEQITSGICQGAIKSRCIKTNQRTFWTIHGLWPSGEKESPESCNKSAKFDPNALQSLRSDLDLYWPSFYTNNSAQFWKHEWLKHGTCAGNIPQLSGQANYFGAILDIYRKYNLTEYLENAGIKPTSKKTYATDDVRKAISAGLKTSANLVCDKVKNFTSPVLTEVRFCIDKSTLLPIDCKYKRQICGKTLYYLPLNEPDFAAISKPSVFLLSLAMLASSIAPKL